MGNWEDLRGDLLQTIIDFVVNTIATAINDLLEALFGMDECC